MIRHIYTGRIRFAQEELNLNHVPGTFLLLSLNKSLDPGEVGGGIEKGGSVFPSAKQLQYYLPSNIVCQIKE